MATSSCRIQSIASNWRMFAMIFLCLRMTPLGLPVVPLEYGMTAISSGERRMLGGGASQERISFQEGLLEPTGTDCPNVARRRLDANRRYRLF
jgi:hypothetical protein